jgi:hypothetical protein
MSYTRCDPVKARAVYKAQAVRRVLGAGAARAYMRGRRLEPALIERVLAAQKGMLRR